MYPEDLAISSVCTYSHALVCFLLQFHNTQYSNSCSWCPSTAHPTSFSLGSGEREKSVVEETELLRWAPLGTDLSPAHLPPVVGPQRAEAALKFSLWQLQEKQRDRE